MPRYKFDDCAECKFRKKKSVCRDCDYGEQFEEEDGEELNFDKHNFRRAEKSLTTEDDEPQFNPGDFFEKVEAEEETRDEDVNDEN